jgi:hypothetical protein
MVAEGERTIDDEPTPKAARIPVPDNENVMDDEPSM